MSSQEAPRTGMPLHIKMLLAFVIGTTAGLIAHF